MALKKEQKEAMKALGFDVDALEAAIKADAETDIKLPAGTFVTDDQLAVRDTQKIAEGKKAGEKEAVNIARTEISKHTGLDLKGDRFAILGEELKTAMNATNDSKIKLLTDQNTALIADNTKFKTEAEQAKTTLETGMFELQIASKITPLAGFTHAETLGVLKVKGITFEKGADGQPVPMKNGQPIVDPITHAPMPFDKSIEVVYKENGFNVTPATPPAGGRGGGDSNPGGSGGGYKTQSAAQKAWQEQNLGKNAMSPECMSFVAEAAKAEPTFNWSE